VLAQCDLHRRHDRRDSVAGAAMNDLIKVDATNATAIQTPLAPNKADISSHLYALFDPAFVQAHPDAWIEIAYGRPDGKLNAAGNFTAFKLEEAVEFAVAKNAAGYNVYVGASLRHGDKPDSGRANGDHVVTASHAWAEYDGAGDDERIQAVLKEHNLKPALVVTTGTVPHVRRHLYFKLDGAVTPEKLGAANTSLCKLLGSDKVQNPDRIMRLAGTVNYPSPDKVGRGYVAELTTFYVNKDARAYSADELIKLVPASSATSDPYDEHGQGALVQGRTDAELVKLLKDSQIGNWHNNMRSAVSTMIGRAMSDSMIKIACAAYCEGETQDADLKVLIDTARKTFNKPNIELPVEGTAANESDVARLNKTHAVLPIGDKTRVVTFGELEEFPGRETIVMTQSTGDFQALQNKYRHTFRDPKTGEVKKVPLGTHWIQSPDRRQYDGGMEFMPQRDGDFGNKLNLWNGFGVKSIKPAPGSKAETGCKMFLDFMKDIICSGDEEDFQYLLKREAIILQKRIRSEIALGLRTIEEGCGKGFFEKVMGRLLGNHAMQVGNPKHIIGAFNPHLQTLLRLTADEALFVGNHEHRNALFGLITEPKLTIEPKGCGVYQAPSYLNMSILSNSEHFLPASGTARRFFVPTVSAARKQDVVFFGEMEAALDAGGYEALLYYFLHDVDLKDFNVRKVPQTAGLREQRDQSLEPLDLWWIELLETGMLMGADLLQPNKAVSNAYDRRILLGTTKVAVDGGIEQTPHYRHVRQLGLYDQARTMVPKLRNTSDTALGAHLTKMGCDNRKKVQRQRGWTFPPLDECRAAWVKRYPDWKWRDPDLTKWQDDCGYDYMIEAIQGGPTVVVNNDPPAEEVAASVVSGKTKF
jgi:hypothetical protein